MYLYLLLQTSFLILTEFSGLTLLVRGEIILSNVVSGVTNERLFKNVVFLVDMVEHK